MSENEFKPRSELVLLPFGFLASTIYRLTGNIEAIYEPGFWLITAGLFIIFYSDIYRNKVIINEDLTIVRTGVLSRLSQKKYGRMKISEIRRITVRSRQSVKGYIRPFCIQTDDNEIRVRTFLFKTEEMIRLINKLRNLNPAIELDEMAQEFVTQGGFGSRFRARQRPIYLLIAALFLLLFLINSFL